MSSLSWQGSFISFDQGDSPPEGFISFQLLSQPKGSSRNYCKQDHVNHPQNTAQRIKHKLWGGGAWGSNLRLALTN